MAREIESDQYNVNHDFPELANFVSGHDEGVDMKFTTLTKTLVFNLAMSRECLRGTAEQLSRFLCIMKLTGANI